MTPRIPRLIIVIGLAAALALQTGCGAGKRQAAQDKSPGPAPYGQEQTGAASKLKEPGQAEESPDPASTIRADSGTGLKEEAAEALPTPSPSGLGAAAATEPSGPPAPDKIAYLTFDDGPSGNTDKILDLLRSQGIHATFFVTGKDTESYRELYRRIAGEGHKLGNHTFSHDYKRLYRDADTFMEDVRRLDSFLKTTTGQGTDILRFPGGSNTRLGRQKGQAWIMPELVKRVRAEGYQYFDWNVTSTDAAQKVQPRADIVSSVMALAKRKERIIVLMHDVTVKTTTVEALPEVILGLKQMGFRFEALTKESFTTQFLK